jgi:hypothetical protein
MKEGVPWAPRQFITNRVSWNFVVLELQRSTLDIRQFSCMENEILWDPWSPRCLRHCYKRRELLTTEDLDVTTVPDKKWAILAKVHFLVPPTHPPVTYNKNHLQSSLWNCSTWLSTGGNAYNLATWEAEIRKIKVQSQPRQTVHETPPISKITRENGLELWLKW